MCRSLASPLSARPLPWPVNAAQTQGRPSIDRCDSFEVVFGVFLVQDLALFSNSREKKAQSGDRAARYFVAMIVNNRNDSLSRRSLLAWPGLAWPGHLELVGPHSENIYGPIKHLSITLQRVQCSMSCQVMFVVHSTQSPPSGTPPCSPPHPCPGQQPARLSEM